MPESSVEANKHMRNLVKVIALNTILTFKGNSNLLQEKDITPYQTPPRLVTRSSER